MVGRYRQSFGRGGGDWFRVLFKGEERGGLGFLQHLFGCESVDYWLDDAAAIATDRRGMKGRLVKVVRLPWWLVAVMTQLVVWATWTVVVWLEEEADVEGRRGSDGYGRSNS